MAIFYFGASVPTSPNNGNWQDLTQWYTDPGYAGSKSSTPGTNATSFPLITDTVYFSQLVTTGVGVHSGPTVGGTWTTDGIWPGPTGGIMANGVGIFTGLMLAGNEITINGNSGNTLPVLSGTYQTGGCNLYMWGGVCNSTMIAGNQIYLYGGTINSTFAAAIYSVELWGGTITNPIKTIYLRQYSSTCAISQCSALNIYNGTVTSDISTANTGGCLKYILAGGTFSNTNPWIFGSPSSYVVAFNLGAFNYYNLSGQVVTSNFLINRDVLIYGSTSTSNLVLGGVAANTTINGLITITPITGQTNVPIGSSSGSGTYSPNATVYITSVNSMSTTNTAIRTSAWPKDYLFASNSDGKFIPKITLLGIKPGTDILGTQLL